MIKPSQSPESILKKMILEEKKKNNFLFIFQLSSMK